MLTLETTVSEFNRVGKATAGKLKRLGIETASDLIFYYPFRYDDFSRVVKIDKLEADMVVTIRGRVDLLASRRTRYKRKSLVEGLISDDSGSVKVVWFNQSWITKNIKVGDEIFLSGKVSGDMFDVYFNSPGYEKVSGSGVHTARLVPIYPLTSGITQKQIRFLIKSVISLTEEVKDHLPPEVIKKNSLVSLARATRQIHFPHDKDNLKRARARLSFDELFLVQLWSQMLKKSLSQQKSSVIKFFPRKTRSFVAGLEFKLTDDQKKTAWEILQDLGRDCPMNRLLEGDVGSGKTVVATMALYNVFLNKSQSVVMAPTEILASQHFKTISNLLEKLGVRVGLFTRSNKVVGQESLNKKEFLERCKKREVDVVIGTHALIQKEVKFKKLVLVVVDEQHRFGVKQRAYLQQARKKRPHLLSLTATPIPRSLALTIYGDLDLSVIKELPKNRKKIITRVALPDKRQLAYNFIARQIKQGRQVFVVCPLIDESDKLGVKSVNQEFKKLDETIFPSLSIGLLHGRLKAGEKEEAMEKFVKNETKILVSTSVVEVGVDVPNATVMMIEGAERFGLAQLHQFRGRVGRSHYQSYCFLFSDNQSPEVANRLKSLVDCSDGFALAQKDLKFRGAGQVYGHKQSGFADLKMADLSDLDLIKKIRAAASDFLESNNLDDFPRLKEELEKKNFSSHLE